MTKIEKQINEEFEGIRDFFRYILPYVNWEDENDSSILTHLKNITLETEKMSKLFNGERR